MVRARTARDEPWNLGTLATVELARTVGRAGRVVGVDHDREALEIARDAADRSGVQVQFVCGEALAPPVRRAAFDLGYARLLLSHLTEPVTALRQLRTAVRPGGVVAVEDLFTGTLRSDPPTGALDALQDIYAPRSGSTAAIRRSVRACPHSCAPPASSRCTRTLSSIP